MEMEEDHPIYKAIDAGGGQICDIQGVLRELAKAGYHIVPKVLPHGAVESRPPFTSPHDITQWWTVMLDTELSYPHP